MILNENDFKVMGFDVKMLRTPVSLIAGKETMAHTFMYDNIDEMKQQDWFNDALMVKEQVPLFMYPLEVDMKPNGVCFRMFWLGKRNDYYR